MRKRRLLAAFAALAALWLPTALVAQTPYASRQAVLAFAFDLDGEAADVDQVVTAANGVVADSSTYTLTANPDICRLVDVTVTDANSSMTAGTLTVTGTDCWDYPLVATFTFAAGGSGVKTLTPTSAARASGAYFKTITEVATGVITGEGGAGDTIEVGYSTGAVKGWPLYGRQTATPSGRRWVDVFGSYAVNCLVKNGAATTDVAAVSASTTACFENVAVGDLLVFNVSGEMFYTQVATRADADTITVSPGVSLPTAGVNFSYKKRFFSTDPIDGWIPVAGYSAVYFVFDVDANANTGGVVSSVECVPGVLGSPPRLADVDAAFEIDTDTVASGSAGNAATSIDLVLSPAYSHCRLGVKFGTGDDADAAAEDINLTVGLGK